MITSKPRLPIREIIFPGLLPSPLKKLVYRLRGYRLGRKVSFGLGSVVSGSDVEIGDGVQVGFLSIVRGKRIRLGPHVQIGAMSFLDTPVMEIGEGTKINEQVFIGGMQFPDSSIIIGRNCQIMQMCFINPTRSIRIGDDTGIGGDCLLFGHTSWLSQFEGYPVDFDSIEIGRSVSIAWRVFLLPGAKIGDGAVIGANSLVRGTIPDRCLAVGFPARVVSKAPEFPRELTGAEKETILGQIVEEMITFFRGSGLTCIQDSGIWRISEVSRSWGLKRTRTWSLSVETTSTQPTESAAAGARVDVLLSLAHLPRSRRRHLDTQATTWIDIEKKERSVHGSPLGEEVVMYLRRHGVRFLRDYPPTTV